MRSTACDAARSRSAVAVARRQNLIAPSGSATPGNTRAPCVRTLPAPTATPSPSTAPPSIVRARRRCARRPPTMQSRSAQPAPISAPCEHDRALDRRCRADLHAAPEHGEAPDVRARGDPHPALDDARAARRGRRLAASSATARKPSASRSPTACRTLPSRMSKVPCR